MDRLHLKLVESHTKKKALEISRAFLVAGARLELTTFGL
jgi:hypothetical protein